MKVIQYYFLERTKGKDWIFALCILLLGTVTIWSGRMNGQHLTPKMAVSTSKILDKLEIPRELPNAPILAEDGSITTLHSLFTNPRNIVSMYASWCGPCQEEIQELAGKIEPNILNVIVIIPKSEKEIDTRNQLNNLGLENLMFYKDHTGILYHEGKVSGIPATFLITNQGRVIERIVGYSIYNLERIIEKATGNRDE